jgi:hypothetical protein
MGMRLSRRVTLVALAVAGISAFAFATSAAAKSSANPSCGDTISVDTTLTTNLRCTGDGLNVAPGVAVTLDLGGHVIEGTGTGVGVRILESDGSAAIKNGTVRGFDAGVAVNGQGTLSNLRITGNGTGVGASFAPVMVTDSLIWNNDDVGVSLVAATHSQIIDNRLTRNGVGIRLGGHSDATLIADNVIFQNSGDGIADTQSSARFITNTIVGNGGNGIALYGNDQAGSYTFTSNFAFGNGLLGISAQALVVLDGGGNVGAGNGDPRQCVNVYCSHGRRD